MLPAVHEEGTFYLGLLNYIDDYGANRALGSHSSFDKLTGMYCTILGCPDEITSKIINIFSTQIFFADDIKRFSFQRLLPKLIEELNFLYEEGIHINNECLPQIKKIKIISGLFTADNLGLNQVLGFTESFRTTFMMKL